MTTSIFARALRLATSGETPVASPAATEAIAECGDLQPLTELAMANRAAPWLAAVVSSSPDLVALPNAEALRKAGARQTLGALALYGELTRVLGRLNRENIPVVVLKGPVLGDTVYPDPGLRPYGDVDVLIHERDLKSVTYLLLSMGYHERYGDDHGETHRLHECHGVFQRNFLNNTTGHTVEVHCDHLQIGLEPVSMDEIWNSAREHRFGSATARALEVHDMFLQLCVHLQRHGYERLIWIKDIDLIVRGTPLDWKAIERKASEQGCFASVAYALRVTSAVLGTPLPVQAQSIVLRHGTISRLLFERTWPIERIANLEPQRQWRYRRFVQFAPETGFFRGGIPAFLTSGRRKDKARVLFAAARRRVTGATH